LSLIKYLSNAENYQKDYTKIRYLVGLSHIIDTFNSYFTFPKESHVNYTLDLDIAAYHTSMITLGKW